MPHERCQTRLHPEHVEAVVLRGDAAEAHPCRGKCVACALAGGCRELARQVLPPCSSSPEAAVAGTLARGRRSSGRTGHRCSSGDGAPPLTGGRCAAPSRGSWHAPAAGDPTSTASFHFPMRERERGVRARRGTPSVVMISLCCSAELTVG